MMVTEFRMREGEVKARREGHIQSVRQIASQKQKLQLNQKGNCQTILQQH